MKKLGIVILGGVVVLAITGGLVVLLTRGPRKTAKDLLSQIRQGRTHEVYLTTADAFRAASREEEFTTLLKGIPLDELRNASWSSRSIGRNAVRVKGTVTKRDGKTILMSLDFLKNGKKWEITSVREIEAGQAHELPAPQMPPEVEVRRMLAATMISLGGAIIRDDFTDFYAREVSDEWKIRTSPGALRETFRGYERFDMDLARLAKRNAIFRRKPFIDEDGMLVLEGYYATRPLPISFAIRYLHEPPDWKLSALDVSM